MWLVIAENSAHESLTSSFCSESVKYFFKLFHEVDFPQLKEFSLNNMKEQS